MNKKPNGGRKEWLKFTLSGRVTDYLSFVSKKEENLKNETGKSTKENKNRGVGNKNGRC